MMYKLKVIDVRFITSFGRCIFSCQDPEGNDLGGRIIEAVGTKTLCAKVGDTIWVLIDDNLDYFGYHAIAVLHI